MKNPLISFITPVFNMEKYIGECVNSVMNQSNPNWELILVDDGSTDRSGELCDAFAGRDKRIKVIHKCNEGQFASRIKGIRLASGRYCSGLDSDDYIEPDCVETLTDIIKEKEYDIISWNIRCFDDENEEIIGKKDRYGEYSGEDFIEYVSGSTDHSFCDKLIKTEILQRSEYVRVPPGLRHSEDYIMICPALCMARSVLALDSVLYNYRQIDNSVTHKYSTKRILDYLESTKCIFDIMSHYSVLSSRLRDLEYKELTKAIGYCLKQAYKSGDVAAQEVERIRSNPIFIELSKYERLKNNTLDRYIIMKLFRFRLDRIISFIYGW